MKKRTRRHPRVGKTNDSNQKKMDGYYYSNSSTYLVQKFALNSFHRQVARKGLGRKPDPAFRRKKKKNPAMTSQKCSACGKRGVRVKDSASTEEEKGGEYFYCPCCESHFHADVNAARNILKIKLKPPTAVGGQTA